MDDVADRYARIADAFTVRVAGCPPGSWSRPSPCPGWTARDVAKHVVDTHRALLTRLSGGDPTPPDSDEDLPSAWRVESAAVRAALADPARAGKVVRSMAGEQPFGQLVGTLLCADTLVHTWDLARATGQDDRLDPGGVAAAFASLEPHNELLRGPHGYGPALAPPDGADEQTRLLCFLGRQP